MESSYPFDRVTRLAGTISSSVYMEPSFSAFMVQHPVVTYLHEVLPLGGKHPYSVGKMWSKLE